MINVRITRSSPQGSIIAFAVRGHAEYDRRGRDIVCAGVSTATAGTVNAIETLTGVVLDSTMKDGFLSATMVPIDDAETAAKVQLLLESMVVMLGIIAQSYGKYIKIQEVTL
ncbi:ribosomal-processing cysteine protease Prp [Paenibacillus sp. HN-1]|uniref:ribosomal-processing cysteine protease Prp n=1 Tax=Paenibacillus TaxID=44249 RepID=UPI001CA932CF|nr:MULTISPECIES: ribosomal-processing cysteine protease Prp [Paenibacillus]MBY9079380.1 ribosomal-processing cysteine protease Prp [Paenibacillus sp. CGMCC 1.18879]MBY9085675.1 ribosomal-processing cysteine protease Prp [Paenibacillus sinensis]